MRGRDGITSQKTVRKPFEKAASVDVAALTALLSVPGTTQKRKNNLPRKKITPALFVVSEKLEKRLKETLSKKLPKLRKRVALNEKNILPS
jgi:hypothetical protein